MIESQKLEQISKKSKKFQRIVSRIILPTYEDFTGKDMVEANEFLKYLLSIFPDEDAPNLLERTYFTNDRNRNRNN